MHLCSTVCPFVCSPKSMKALYWTTFTYLMQTQKLPTPTSSGASSKNTAPDTYKLQMCWSFKLRLHFNCMPLSFPKAQHTRRKDPAAHPSPAHGIRNWSLWLNILYLCSTCFSMNTGQCRKTLVTSHWVSVHHVEIFLTKKKIRKQEECLPL